MQFVTVCSHRGTRLRPALVLMAAEAASGGPIGNAIPAAVAVEMVASIR